MKISRRVVVVSCLLAVLAGAVGGSSAYASWGSYIADPQAWGELSADDQDAVLQFLSRGTPGEATTYATTPEAQEGAQLLESAFAATRPADAGAALVADAGAAAQQAKLVPTAEKVIQLVGPRTINPVTALFTLNAVVIAHDIRYLMKFGDHDIPPSPPGTWAITAFRYQWFGGGAIYSSPAPQNLPAGLYASHDGTWSSGWAWSDDDPYPRNAPPYPFEDGDRFNWEETHGNWATNGAYLPRSFQYFVRIRPGDRPFGVLERPRAANPDETGVVVPWTVATDPRGALADGFGDPHLSDFRDWVCHVLGSGCPDPYVGFHMTPDCSNLVYENCLAELRNAGFTGRINQVQLDADDAYMAGQAGRVTTTRPGPNLSIVENREFDVFINPAPMPAPSATEQSIADALQARNPSVITADNKLTIARQCVRFALAASRATGDCSGLPVFVTGFDAVTPAVNDRAALVRNPSWFALNRRTPPARKGWYSGRATPEPGCVNGAGDNMTKPQCDEFPFWSTLQAYGGTLQTLVPSIRWTPRIENEGQGRALGYFYGSSGYSQSYGFAGCNVQAQSASSTVPTAASTFLNVPLPPGIPIPSLGICNRP